MTKYPEVFKKKEKVYLTQFSNEGEVRIAWCYGRPWLCHNMAETQERNWLNMKQDVSVSEEAREWVGLGSHFRGDPQDSFTTGSIWRPPPRRQSRPDYLLLAPPLIGLSNFQFVLFRNQASNWVGSGQIQTMASLFSFDCFLRKIQKLLFLILYR